MAKLSAPELVCFSVIYFDRGFSSSLQPILSLTENENVLIVFFRGGNFYVQLAKAKKVVVWSFKKIGHFPRGHNSARL